MRRLSARHLERFYTLTDMPAAAGRADGQTQGGMRTVTNVPVFPEGTVEHPEYGELDFSRTKLLDYVANFDDKVRRIDIAVDIDHKNEDAVGWIKNLSYHPGDGVYAEVEFNQHGQALLSDKRYRYISPQFGEYVDETSGEKYDNVLIALTITNFPFLKDMPSLSLAEHRPTRLIDRARAAVLADYSLADRRLFERLTSTRKAAEHDQKCRLGCQRCAMTTPRRRTA